MRKTIIGWLTALVFFAGGVAFWVIAYYTMPNSDSHRNLKDNPAVAISASSNSAAASTTSGNAASAAPKFYSLGQGNTLLLDMNAGESNNNQGMNFNGYYNGNLVITVPLNWNVDFTFAVKGGPMPHSLGVLPWSERTGGSNFTPAFSGSLPPDFQSGLVQGDPAEKLNIVANKAGQYAVACGLPGHAAGGMWVELDVSSSVKAPTIKTPSGTVTVK